MWKEKVVVKGPYNADLALQRLEMDPLNKVNLEQREIWVPIYIDVPEVAYVQAIGTTDDPEFWIFGHNDQTKAKVLKTLEEIFQWNVSLKEITAHLQKTSLKELFHQHYGTPLVRDFAPFTTLIKSVIHQQINLSFAHQLTAAFVKKFGTEQDGVYFYPSLHTIAQIDAEQLREMKFSGRKAEYLIGLGTLVEQGELSLERLVHLSDKDVTKELMNIRGIGPWTAQNYLLFGLGRSNLFPFTDIGIQRAWQNVYEMSRKPTIEEMQTETRKWEPYLSYAALYLWRSIE